MRFAHIRVVVLAAVVALLGTLTVAGADTASAVAPVTVSGTVHLSDGGPITGDVSVVLLDTASPSNWEGSVIVGANGAFSFDATSLATGTYQVAVWVSGMPYRDILPDAEETPTVHVTHGVSVSGFDVTLQRFHGLGGVATIPASAGDPSRGGWVTLVSMPRENPVATGYFGSNGVFYINTETVARGEYTLRATASGASNTYLGNVSVVADAARILVVPGDDASGLDIDLGDAVKLSGTFSNPGGVEVTLTAFADNGETYDFDRVDSAGSSTYQLDIPAGVEVFIEASVDGQAPIFVGGGSNPDNAHRFEWASAGAQTLPGFSVSAAATGHTVTATVSITGHPAVGTQGGALLVTTDGNFEFDATELWQSPGFYAAPGTGDGSLADIERQSSSNVFESGFTDGALSIAGVPDGTYTLKLDAYSAAGGFGSSYLGGAQFVESATTFTVSGADVDLGAVTIDGHSAGVRGVVRGDGTATETDNVRVSVLAQNPTTSEWKNVTPRGDGGVAGGVMNGLPYQLDLPPGTYRIAAWDEGVNGRDPGYRGEFYDGAALLADSTPVTVTAGTYTEGIDFDLSALAPVSSTRFAGADRYATAVEVSKTFSPGVSVVYVASGENFPDALAAAPAAAASGGPLLTVRHNGVPDVVAAELARLNPDRIVVVGGELSVNAAVFAELGTYAGSGGISRLFGANRYATAQAIVDDVWAGTGPGSNVVWIASGKGFPDALSAAAAAGSVGAPVITVDGSATTLDPAVVQLIQDLGADTVYIAGGFVSVSASLEAQLKAVPGVTTVTRRAGGDRYSTGAAINYYSFDHPTTAYIANGTNFPDALAGAALAGHNNAPLYIVPGACVPAFVVDDLNRMGVTTVNILGGTAAVNIDIHHVTVC